MKTINGPTSGPFKKTAIALLVSSALAGCSGGGGGSDNKDEQGSGSTPAASVSVSGTAIKGILANAIVEAFAISDVNGSTPLATATTNAEGKYTLPAFSHDGPILVKLKTSADTKAICDSTVGCKDSNGNTVAFGETYTFNDSNFSLSAVLPDAAAAADQSLMVTPITHMAAQRVIHDGASTSDAIKAINVATASLLGLDGIDINTVAPVDITNPSAAAAGTPAQQLYAALVASIQTIAEKDPDSSVADIVNNLAADYSTDGGLTSNSTDAAKITLEEIFSNATEVVAAAEQAAEQAGIELDLDKAETHLGLEEAEAVNAEPDTEETVTPVIPVVPTVPVVDTDTDTTTAQSRATAKGIALLNDLNTWQDALTADNQSLVQPFEDQLVGSGDVLNSLEAQTKVLQGFYSLVGKTVEEDYCIYTDTNGNCLEFDSTSEVETGPLINVIGAIAGLVELTGYLEESQVNENTTSGTFNYGQQLGSVVSYETEQLNDLINEVIEGETEADDIDVEAYSLIANYTAKDNKIDRVTFIVTALDPEGIYDNEFSIVLTQDGFNDDGLRIGFFVESATFDVPSSGLSLNIPAGEAAITFESADARKAFATDNSSRDPSLAAVTAIDVHLSSQAIHTVVSEGETLVTTGRISIDLDYDRGSNAETTSVISFGVDIGNDNGEKLKGDLALTVNGDFSETEDAILGFSQIINIADADAKFTGEIEIAGTSAQGISESAGFAGEIATKTHFLAANASGEQLINNGDAAVSGTVTINSGGNITQFTGNAAIEMEMLKTPNGKPFILNGIQYHMNKATLFGGLSTQRSTGEMASLEINAVVTADVEGVIYPEVNVPQEGDLYAQLHYGINSINEDSAVLYVNYMNAYNDGIAKLATTGLVVDRDENQDNERYTPENLVVHFSRNNCAPLENSMDVSQVCDITVSRTNNSIFNFPPHGLTTEEKKVFVKDYNYYSFLNYDNPFGYSPSVEVVIGECVVYEGHEACDVTATQTAVIPGINQSPEYRLTQFIADAYNWNDLNLIIPQYYGAYFGIETQYGELEASTRNAYFINFDGNQPVGIEIDKTIDINVEGFYSDVQITQFDTVDAYIEMSAALRMSASLTGLDDAEITVYADRIGLEDFSGSVKLVNGVRAIELVFDTSKSLSDAAGTNLQISNADALMTINASCASDLNDEGIQDNSGIVACADGINFQGDVVVDGLKVADLEDRDGLPVFRFSDGSGFDLIATPNLLIQPTQ